MSSNLKNYLYNQSKKWNYLVLNSKIQRNVNNIPMVHPLCILGQEMGNDAYRITIKVLKILGSSSFQLVTSYYFNGFTIPDW